MSTRDDMIVEFARMFAINEVESAVLEKAIMAICKEFCFDSAALYEIGENGHLSLKEHFSSVKATFVESISMDAIGVKYSGNSENVAVSYVHSIENATEYETNIMRILNAKSAFIAPVIDAETSVDGFAIFYNEQEKESLTGEQKQDLSVLIVLLGRYAASRLYVNKIRAVQNSLESIMDNTGIDIYVNDFQTHDILYVNKSMAAPYGGADKFKGNKCWETLFPGQNGPCEFCPQKKIVDENGNPTKVYTWDYQRAFDGSWFRVFSAAFRWVDGRIAHVVSSADITDNKRNEELIQYMANYDALTNLPNRRMLVAECERRIDQADEDETGYVLFFDVDGFKNINDTLGHDAGDEFLVEMGKFFSGIPLLKDSFYRNGGDEFVAILDGNITEISVTNLIRFIHLRFEKPWKLKAGEVFCGTSVGVACFPEDGVTAEELLNKADKAMYVAKKRGGKSTCFVREM